MQLIVGREAGPVGRGHVVEMLTVQDRRMRVGRVPLLGEDDVLDGRQLELSALWREDERFGTGGIELAVAGQLRVHVMYAHGPFLRAGDAAARKGIPGACGCADILQLRGRLAHDSSQRPIGALALRVRRRGWLASSDVARQQHYRAGHHAGGCLPMSCTIGVSFYSWGLNCPASLELCVASRLHEAGWLTLSTS